MGFRNSIGKLGLQNVQSYLKKSSTDRIQEYVENAFDYHGEIPFLYKSFQVTEEKDNTGVEKGGYKVVRNLDLNPSLPSFLHIHTDPPWTIPPQGNYAHDDGLLSSHQIHRSRCL
jgi:hypothetical protein